MFRETDQELPLSRLHGQLEQSTSAKPSQVPGIRCHTTYDAELQGDSDVHLEGAHQGHQRFVLLPGIARCPFLTLDQALAP